MPESSVATTHLHEEAPSPSRSAAAPEAAAPEVAPESAQALVRSLHPTAAAGGIGAPTPPPPPTWTARRSTGARDLVALQRMAGNRAVATLVSRSSASRSSGQRPSVQRNGPEKGTPPPGTTGEPEKDKAKVGQALEIPAQGLHEAAERLSDGTVGLQGPVIIIGLQPTFAIIYNKKGKPISDRIKIELKKGMHFNQGVYAIAPGGGPTHRLRHDPTSGRVVVGEVGGFLVEMPPKPAGPAGGGGASGGAAPNGKGAAAPPPKGPDKAKMPTSLLGTGDDGNAPKAPGSGQQDAATAPAYFNLRYVIKDLPALEAALKDVPPTAWQFYLVPTIVQAGEGHGGGARTAGFGGEIEGKGKPANRPAWPVTMEGPKMLPIGGKGNYLANINWQAQGGGTIGATTAQMGNDIHYRWELFDITEATRKEREKQERLAKQAREQILTTMAEGLMPDVEPPKGPPATGASSGTGGKGAAGNKAANVPKPAGPAGTTPPLTTANALPTFDDDTTLADEKQQKTGSKAGTGTDMTGAGGRNEEFQREFKNLWADTKRTKAAIGESKADSFVERRSDDIANVTAVGLLPISALVTVFGASLRWGSDVFAGERQQQEIPIKAPGTYLIRVITTPRVQLDKDGNELIYPSSVASQTVEVVEMERMIKEGLDEPGAREAEAAKALKKATDDLNAGKGSKEEVAALTKKYENVHLDVAGDPRRLLEARIADKKLELAVVEKKWGTTGVKGPIIEVQDQLEVLEQRLKLYTQQERERQVGAGTESRLWAPAERINATLTSEVTGQSYPLVLSLGPMAAAAGKHKWKVLDATSKKAEGFEGDTSATISEAIESALRKFGGDAQYGKGTIGVRLPAAITKQLAAGEKSEYRIPSQPIGWAVARGRLDDLVMTLVALGLIVASAGTAAAVIGGAVAAAKLIHRLFAGTLELDVETVTDFLAVFGAAGAIAQSSAKATQVAAGVRVKKLGDLFVLLPESAELEARFAQATTAFARAGDIMRKVEWANEALGYTGLAFGNATFLLSMADISIAESQGTMTHAEARRARATAIGGAMQNNGLFLAGNRMKARAEKKAADKAAAAKASSTEKPATTAGTTSDSTTGAPKDPAAPVTGEPVIPKDTTSPRDPAAPKDSAAPKEPPTPARPAPEDAPTKGAEPKKGAAPETPTEPIVIEPGAVGEAGPAGARPTEPAGGTKPGETTTAKPAMELPPPGSAKAKGAAKQVLQGVVTSSEPHAGVEDAIKMANGWKEALKAAIGQLSGPDRAAAEKAVVEVRQKIVNETWDAVQRANTPRFDNLRLENTGTTSFGSDIDATIRPLKGTEAEGAGTHMGEQIKAAGEAAQAMSEALRTRLGGGETDVVIDTNIYSFIGEGRINPADPKARAAQQQVDIVVGLAEQMRGQSDQQFKEFEQRLGARLGDPRVGAEAKALLGKARDFHAARKEELGGAMKRAKDNPANKSDAQQRRAAREELLVKKKGELADLIGQPQPDIQKITEKQAEINWYAPDAYATPSAFKQAVAHGQRLKGTGKTVAELSATEVAGQLRDAAAKLPADDPRGAKMKTDADLVDSQGKLLDTTNSELKAAQAEAPMDVKRVNELEARAAKLREAIATPAERLLIGELFGETASAGEPSAKRLSQSAAASGANMGMLTEHVHSAKDVDGKVKAAAKYAGRIAMAEWLSGLRPGADPISRLIGDFVKGRWGIMEEATPQIMRDMFVRYGRLKGRQTELTYNSRGEATGATDALKQAFVDDVSNWARDTNDGIQAAAIGKKAFENPTPTTPSLPGAGETAPKPPPAGAEPARPGVPEQGPRAGHASNEESPAGSPERPKPAAPVAITRSGVTGEPGRTPVLDPPGVDGLFAFRMESFREASSRLRRIANGDARALSEKGVELPPGYSTHGREFGLAALPDGTYAIIQGADAEVHWYKMPPGSVPLMHTHPYQAGRGLSKPGSVREIVRNATAGVEAGTSAGHDDAVRAFPSGSDTVWAAANNVANHDVASPYVHTGDGVLRNPTGAANERQVNFKISGAKLVGNYGAFPVAESIITVHDTDGTILWMGKMWGANLAGASMIRFEPIQGLLPLNPETMPFKNLPTTRSGAPGGGGDGPATRREGAVKPPDSEGPATRREGAGAPATRRGSEFGQWIPVEGLEGGAWVNQDSYALTVRSEKDPSAAVRIEGTGKTLTLTSVDRRDLPKGTGSILIAEALRVLRAGPGTELIIFGIINPETIEAYKTQRTAPESLLGKSADKALAMLGLTARAMRWEHIHGKLSIVVDVN